MEIKAGTTYIPEMTKSLQRFRSLKDDLAGSALLYSGEETATVDGIKVVPYTEIARILFTET